MRIIDEHYLEHPSDDTNAVYLLGNLDYPAHSTIERDLNQDIVYITCENADPLVS